MRPLPDHRYIPGAAPRHPESAFDDIRALADPVTMSATARRNPAWAYGLHLFNHGYWWEAHEVWEEVWMRAADGSREKLMTQAVIQLANAALKVLMDKPRATLRLCDITEAKAREAGAGVVMGIRTEDVVAAARALRDGLEADVVRLNWAEEVE